MLQSRYVQQRLQTDDKTKANTFQMNQEEDAVS